MTSKLQKKPLALKREHPALQNMRKKKSIFVCPGYESTDLTVRIQSGSGSNPDPDLIRIRIRNTAWTLNQLTRVGGSCAVLRYQGRYVGCGDTTGQIVLRQIIEHSEFIFICTTAFVP
jgi:hypothetical protein